MEALEGLDDFLRDDALVELAERMVREPVEGAGERGGEVLYTPEGGEVSYVLGYVQGRRPMDTFGYSSQE